MKLNVPDMSCGHCISSIRDAIAKLDATATLEFDLDSKTVTIASQKPAADVSEALDKIGFGSTITEG